ncbi:UNVERIFIED_CONTAM: hypothetical protein HDU68_006496 [Siphonaria sp. JEL0065]|nr:hypothetical protein HDU68_006496 [Siphonaria sp. JEL0065]
MNSTGNLSHPDMERVPSLMDSSSTATSGTSTPSRGFQVNTALDPALFRETLQRAFSKDAAAIKDKRATRNMNLLFTNPPESATLAVKGSVDLGAGVAMMRDGWMVSSFPAWLPKDSVAFNAVDVKPAFSD